TGGVWSGRAGRRPTAGSMTYHRWLFAPLFRNRFHGWLPRDFHQADLVPEIHGTFTPYDLRRARQRAPSVEKACDSAPDVPVWELGLVGPPVRDFVFGQLAGFVQLAGEFFRVWNAPGRPPHGMHKSRLTGCVSQNNQFGGNRMDRFVCVT